MDLFRRWVVPNWISILRGLQDLTGYVPEKPSLIRPALRRRLDWMTSGCLCEGEAGLDDLQEVPSNTNYSLIPWFCRKKKLKLGGKAAQRFPVLPADCWHWNKAEGRHVCRSELWLGAAPIPFGDPLPFSWFLTPLNPNCKFTALPLKKTTHEKKYPSACLCG